MSCLEAPETAAESTEVKSNILLLVEKAGGKQSISLGIRSLERGDALSRVLEEEFRHEDLLSPTVEKQMPGATS